MQRIIAAALFALFAFPAYASNLYISEYGSVGQAVYATGGAGGVLEVAQEPSLQQSPVSFSSGAASSAAFGTNTHFVRLVCDAACSVLFGPSPQTATASNAYLAAGIPEYFGVVPGQIVSVHSNP